MSICVNQTLKAALFKNTSPRLDEHGCLVVFEQGISLSIEQHLEDHPGYDPIPTRYSPADAMDFAPIAHRRGRLASVLGRGTEAHALAVVVGPENEAEVILHRTPLF